MRPNWRMMAAAGSLLLGGFEGAAAESSEFNLSCRPDEVLVGISGRQAWWMGGVAARCRAIDADGTLGAVRTTAYRGGTDAALRTFGCGPSEVMVGYRGSQGDNGYVLHVHEIVCASWQPHSRMAGASTRRLPAFDQKPGRSRAIGDACLEGQVGTRLRGRAGQYLDRLMDMGCSHKAGGNPPTAGQAENHS